MAGIGCYWCIVEMLFEEGGEIPLEYERISFELRSDNDTIKSVIHDFELFGFDDKQFWSDRALQELQERCTKSAKARESIEKRWNKKRNTTVIRSYKKRNTKEKSIEEYRIEENSPAFKLWLQYKKERKETYKSESSIQEAYKHLMTLAGGSPDVAMLIVKQSMANNWAGLFDLKKKFDSKPEPKQPTQVLMSDVLKRSGVQ
jgi:hypothetical protein